MDELDFEALPFGADLLGGVVRRDKSEKETSSGFRGGDEDIFVASDADDDAVVGIDVRVCQCVLSPTILCYLLVEKHGYISLVGRIGRDRPRRSGRAADASGLD